MDRSGLRNWVIVLGTATGLIHLSLNVPFAFGEGLIFTINGTGYLALVALFAFTRRPAALQWAFMGYAFVTILGWVAIGYRVPIAYMDKAIEVALVAALWLYQRASSRAAMAA